MPRESKVKKRERAIEFCTRMDELYPQPTPALDFSDPFQCVVAVALSAQTTDANKVTPELFARWGTPGKMAQADVNEVEKVIWTIGFHHNKARNCVNCARMIMSDFGGEVPQSMEELQKLPGVGRKSANLILGDVFRQPGAVVVDTHCIRLSNRLGLVDNDKDPVRIEKALRAVLPPEKSNDFCHRLVLHGRAVCTARKPLCDICCCAAYCKTLNQ